MTAEDKPKPDRDPEEIARIDAVFDEVEREFAERDWEARGRVSGMRLVPFHKTLGRAGTAAETQLTNPDNIVE